METRIQTLCEKCEDERRSTMLKIDMPMPKNCLDCNYHKVLYENNAEMCVVVCKMESKVVGKRFGKLKDLCRPSWCPIKGELVRCKDCRWACLAPQRQTATCMKKRLPFTHEYDWFCADGERKDGEHEC